MTQRATQFSRKPTGFMITELIVVISLLAILFGMLLPSTTVMRKLLAQRMATELIATAVATARAYATTTRANLQNSGDPTSAGFRYSGAAVLFTPAGELRLVNNHQRAVNGSNRPLEPEKNGYIDIAGRDYIRLPRDAGVVGIARRGNLASASLYLLAPPFAVRYNEQGNLIAGVSRGHRVVYYDGDYDGRMVVSNDRDGDYDPDHCDPSSPTFDASCWHTTQHKYKVPFEAIETVVGIVIYSKNRLRGAGYGHTTDQTTSGSINADAKSWILDNGETVLFNRYTGGLIRRGAS